MAVVSCSDIQSFLSSKKTEHWKAVGKDIVLESKYCPEAVTQYAAKPQKILVNDVRNHLAYLGWKIESSREGGNLRFRYTSPDDAKRSYLSLHKVCSDLRAAMYNEEINVQVQEIERMLGIVPQVPEEPNKTQMLDVQQVVNSSPGNCSKLTETSNDNVFVESEYCPQAVVDWYLYDCKNKDTNIGVKPAEMKMKAKKHLSYMGVGVLVWNEGRRGAKDGEIVALNGNFSTYSFDMGTMDSSSVMQSRKRTREVDLSTPELQLCETEDNVCQMKVESAIGYEGNKKLKTLKDEKTSPPKRRRQKKILNMCRLGDRQKGTKRISRSSKRVRQGVVPSSSNVNPRTVLSWLIDNNGVLPREKVYYQGREDHRPILEGKITRDGIKCNCCQKVFTLGGFQTHAAGITPHKPAASIFTDGGRSLLDCQMQLMRMFEANSNHTVMNGNWKQGENDDVCSVCHYGGELILCDSCPSSFHENCLGLKNVPDGDWFCPSCSCGICGQRKTGDTQFPGDDEFLCCYQCEHKYHIGCLRSTDRLQNYHPDNNWFCSSGCEGVFVGLRMLLGKPFPVGSSNLSWTILQYSDRLDVESLTESYSKLKVAVEVMHECFEPVKDARNSTDLVEDVVFCRRSHLNRSNYKGFYTILLERNDEIISVANVRIHGQKAAELPLVGTRFHYRHHGMCRVLMNELERQLRILGVEKLILPSVPAVLHTWTNCFGFSIMTKSERLQHLDTTFLDFQETVMCQKHLVKTSSIPSWPKLVLGNSNNYDDLYDSSPKSEVLNEEDEEKKRFVEEVLLDCPVEETFG
ncbi:unnamed protein product [Dovyalis caffra]|uniref:Uncharacterized protein n=1 Tax=Dovyalis caffra TaxID=77055 RepID=A0AAV1S7N3_9ROSI|nr:unnamed protein product [Dovyalis caffra]